MGAAYSKRYLFGQAHFLENMSALSQVTLILDLDGYRLSSGQFIVRELGWCTIKGENDSQHFYSPLRYRDLSYKDRRTVNYVYRHVHGLRFEAAYKEAALPQRDVEGVIRALYKDGLIAYKGSQIEKEFLENMGLPCVDLEAFGCPKTDALWSSHYPSGKSCGHHKVDTMKFIHCPNQETYLFYNWLKSQE